MPLDADFIADSPYAPDGLFIDEVVEIDTENSRLVARMPTHDDLDITTSSIYLIRSENDCGAMPGTGWGADSFGVDRPGCP